MSETAPEPVAAPAEPAALEAAPDHESLLHEIAAHIRTVAASPAKDVSELLAWVASKGL